MRESTGFELAGEAEHLGVLWDEVLVQFAEDEQLWPPVLSVQRSLLQFEQTVAGSLQTEAGHTIAPLLLSTESK